MTASDAAVLQFRRGRRRFVQRQRTARHKQARESAAAQHIDRRRHGSESIAAPLSRVAFGLKR